MLSRIAQSLYWIGRYVERAEDTARLLDAYFHLLVEERYADEAQVCRTLLDAMGVDAEVAGPTPDAPGVSSLLAQNLTFAGSIPCSFGAAWENARGARDAVSSELWEALNSTHREFPRRARSATGPARHDYFGWVRGRAATCNGIVDATMSRDDGWRFLVLGRSLERADMTSRLLSARSGDALGSTGWTTTLRSCSAFEAYVQTYRRGVDAPSAVEFLLLDRLFPRSVYHALAVADDRLAELDPRAPRAGVDDEARRRLGRVRAELEFLRVDDALADLPNLLRRLQDACAEVDVAVGRRYFEEARAIEWSV
ncbi:MAG: alpha-E domain-containing protein [Acidimicrobiia bacterium]